MRNRIAALCALVLALGLWHGRAEAGYAAPMAPTLLGLVSPFPGITAALGLGSDLGAASSIDLTDPQSPIITNPAGTTFLFQLKLTGAGLGSGLVSILDNGASVIGAAFEFTYGGEAYALGLLIDPSDDLAIIGYDEVVGADSILFSLLYTYAADPASSVVLSICCDSEGQPLPFAALTTAPVPVPEVPGLALLPLGFAALALARRRRAPV